VKVLLDEHLPVAIALELRSGGVDAVAVGERPDLVGSSDVRIADAAAAEGRAVVTNNVKDFRPIAAERLTAGRGHGGLILVPAARSRRKSAIGVLADGIEELATANPGGIADSERWLPPIEGPV
jgi:Domain of unknown function (DUF5615)